MKRVVYALRFGGKPALRCRKHAANSWLNMCFGACDQRPDLFRRNFFRDQIVYFERLIAGNGRKLVQKLVDTYSDAQVITESLDSNTGSTKNRGAILDFGVYGDCVELSHPVCGKLDSSSTGQYQNSV